MLNGKTALQKRLFHLTKEKLTFADGLVYSEKDWDYCTEADRRFFKERTDGFIPGKNILFQAIPS